MRPTIAALPEEAPGAHAAVWREAVPYVAAVALVPRHGEASAEERMLPLEAEVLVVEVERHTAAEGADTQAVVADMKAAVADTTKRSQPNPAA